MTTVLVTGACGFVGRHVCDYLKQLQPAPKIIGLDVKDNADTACDSFCRLNLASTEDLAELIERYKPAYIIHLAGIFGTQDHLEIYRANVLFMAALLEAVRRCAPNAVIVAAGSAAEYGQIAPDRVPVDEQTPCRPVTPYGLSKLLATQIALYYHRLYNICVTVVRPFQLIGKGVSVKLAPGAFARQLQQARSNGTRTIKVGNLETARDFLDVHDAVEALWALCQKPACGQVFNLCCGKPTKISELLRMMIEQCGINAKVEVDPARLRGKSDISSIYGSYQRLKDHCGWTPKRSLRESIAQMFEHQ